MNRVSHVSVLFMLFEKRDVVHIGAILFLLYFACSGKRFYLTPVNVASDTASAQHKKGGIVCLAHEVLSRVSYLKL